eukprot:TRINITY_DN39528_c0_g1_i1.p1 TRINITY_DN39528_c0_g1~~TRINITY_DN39528_c0_g1_i1.p1  ORF type:complete len:481 (+),score=72.83 TRINITY_DN39528_c0_g1_i1:122-1564(+)
MARSWVQNCFILFGTAALLPWNVMLNSMGYINFNVFPGRGWSLILTPAWMACSVCTQVLLLWIGGEFIKDRKLILFAAPMAMVCALVLPVCMTEMLPEVTRYRLALGASLGLGILANGIIQSCCGKLAVELMAQHGALPAMYSIGLAAAGIFSFVVSVGGTSTVGHQLTFQGLFVLLAVLFLIIFISYCQLLRAGVISKTDEEGEQLTSEAGGSTANLSLAMSMTYAEAGSIVAPVDEAAPTSVVLSMQTVDKAATTHEQARQSNVSAALSPLSTCSTRSRSPRASRGPLPPQSPSQRLSRRTFDIAQAVRRNRHQKMNLFILYFQTFLAFPTITTEWRCPPEMMRKDDYQLLLTCVFQVFDLLGRLLCSDERIIKKMPEATRLWMAVALRTLLLPLFVVGWKMPNGVFGTMMFHGSLMAIFALTNGMVTNLAFMFGSTNALPEDRDTVGRALPLATVLGIAVGSALSSTLVLEFNALWT